MAAIAGKGGEARISANTIAEVQTWSIDIGTNVIDTTAQLAGGVQWKTFIAGVSEWTVSLEMSWDVPTDTNGQAAMNTASLAGTTISDLTLYPNASNTYTGDAIITSANINNDVQDKVSYTVELQGTGALVYA
jgi:predicted secreted protein